MSAPQTILEAVQVQPGLPVGIDPAKKILGVTNLNGQIFVVTASEPPPASTSEDDKEAKG